LIKIYHTPYLKIYDDWREKILLDQGLNNHPDVALVDNPNDADLIVQNLLSHLHDNTKYDPQKLIFVDLNDKSSFARVDCLCYFKRSVVTSYNPKINSIKQPIQLPSRCYKITYGIFDQFLLPDQEKTIDIGCFFGDRNISHNYNRSKAFKIAEKFSKEYSCFLGLVTEDNTVGRGHFDKKYLEILKRTKIIVHCQPDRWDGDTRTWEAFASGALVAVDKIFGLPDPQFIDREHCILYDSNTLQGFQYLEESLRYYLEYPEERERVALAGYQLAMNHHRLSNRIDYMLRVANSLTCMAASR
jgi:hypothetical protein